MNNLPQAPECEASPNQRHQFSTSTQCDHCHRGAVIVDGQVLYVPSLKQQEYHQANAKNVLFYGGRGSGKSLCGRWDAHMRALSIPGFKYCILRRTYPELEKSHLIELPREMKLLGGDWNATSKQARYPNGSVGFFSHCQNEQDALNLLSSEFYLMFFDEISTFEWEMFRKLAASVRVPSHMREKGVRPMVRAATNPLGVSAEMIDRYWVTHEVDRDEDERYNPSDWLSIQANVEDNPYLDQAEYLAQFSGLPEHVRKAWVDGEFSLENALFDFQPNRFNHLGVKRPYHVIPELDFPKLAKAAVFYRAIDSGWFPDPTVVLWIAHLGNRYIVFHEMVRNKTTAEDMAHLILEQDKILAKLIYPDSLNPTLKVAITYCDPSMDINTTADIRTIKEVYESNGIPMENSINDRERFATAVHNTLAEEAGEFLPRIQFYRNPYNKTEGCPYLVRTIPQMRFKQTNPKAMDDHKDDHAVVTLAYFLLSHSADQRSEIPFGATLPKWMRPKKSNLLKLGADQVRKKDWKH